ncbi:MAG TPA: molybdopterin oxidoreductase, partial [Desulfobacteraceae bacterium]|nr:molybdopterin oxidoreductase [Desulfobacteraceae bacterium]
WPWTFFLFTWSAAACGPCFTIMLTKLLEKITKKKLVADDVIELLAK